MKLAMLSDIHANLQALSACLQHARQQGAERYALLGDHVGYGADPDAVMDIVMALHAEGAIVIKGNHDEMAVNPPAGVETVGQTTAAWTHGQLSAGQRGFLDQLPMVAQDGECLFVHASADHPEAWHYVQDERSAGASLDGATQTHPETHYVFGGHVHQQTLYYRGAGRGLMAFTPTPAVVVPTPRHRQWVATVGSVGQPRDGHPQAMYALFDSAAHKLTFFRVAYDHASAAAAILRAGLPPFFAQRLELGK